MSRSTSRRWWQYGFELFTVFLGVSLAFLVNRWQENQRGLQLKQEYLKSFYTEVQHNQMELDSVIQSNAAKIFRLQRMMDQITERRLHGDTLVAMMRTVLSLHLLEPGTSVFDAAKYSGRLNVLDDPALEQELVRYYKNIQEIRVVQEFLTQHFQQQLLPYLQERFDLLRGRLVNRSMLSDPQFGNLVSIHFSLVQQNLQLYRKVQRSGEQLLEKLRAAISS
ncbi:MAG: hypothetical protein GXO78_11045 [Calditrichaeota bacterium]|nr:hypothetical protein [Calditrichota bacterium]